MDGNTLNIIENINIMTLYDLHHPNGTVHCLPSCHWWFEVVIYLILTAEARTWLAPIEYQHLAEIAREPVGLSNHSDRPEFVWKTTSSENWRKAGVANVWTWVQPFWCLKFQPRTAAGIHFPLHRFKGIKTSSQIDRNIEYWTSM